ncbi:MAG: hypothetical protein H6737_14140 [Alphaproteobacteria bacterium]|nr:hypothetical protein [Alphaproteobacteria bacterium]
MPIPRPAALTAATVVLTTLVACTYQIQLVNSWVSTPLPAGTYIGGDLEVSESGQHAVRMAPGNPYTYLQCIDPAGNEIARAPMKQPYYYRGVILAPSYSNPGTEDIWAIVTYEPNGPFQPAYAWLQRLDATCHHQAFVSIPQGGVPFGAMTDLTMRTTNKSVFVVSTTNAQLHHLRRYDQVTGSWSAANELYDGGFPVSASPNGNNRLHYDAYTDELVYGAEEHLVIHPTSFADIGYRILDVPTGSLLRDWRVHAEWTVGITVPTGAGASAFALFEDDGSLNLYDSAAVQGAAAIDLGEPDPNAGTAPLWLYGTVPGTSAWSVHEHSLQFLSL